MKVAKAFNFKTRMIYLQIFILLGNSLLSSSVWAQGKAQGRYKHETEIGSLSFTEKIPISLDERSLDSISVKVSTAGSEPAPVSLPPYAVTSSSVTTGVPMATAAPQFTTESTPSVFSSVIENESRSTSLTVPVPKTLFLQASESQSTSKTELKEQAVYEDAATETDVAVNIDDVSTIESTTSHSPSPLSVKLSNEMLANLLHQLGVKYAKPSLVKRMRDKIDCRKSVPYAGIPLSAENYLQQLAEFTQTLTRIMSESYIRSNSNSGSNLKIGSTFTGICLGAGIAYVNISLGPDTGVHELVGHMLLGGQLLLKYKPDYKLIQITDFVTDPQSKVVGHIPANGNYEVDGFINARRVKDFATFCNWLKGYDVDHDGNSGYAFVHEGVQFINDPQTGEGYYNRTLLGKKVGKLNSDAFISLAGSLPAVGIYSMAGTLGVNLMLNGNHPYLSGMLMGSTISHFAASGYPITAAVMDPAEFAAKAQTGHDFANFAQVMSSRPDSHISAKQVAINTAALYSLSVPIMMFNSFLSYYAHKVPQIETINLLPRIYQDLRDKINLLQTEALAESTHSDLMMEIDKDLLLSAYFATFKTFAHSQELLQAWEIEKTLPNVASTAAAQRHRKKINNLFAQFNHAFIQNLQKNGEFQRYANLFLVQNGFGDLQNKPNILQKIANKVSALSLFSALSAIPIMAIGEGLENEKIKTVAGSLAVATGILGSVQNMAQSLHATLLEFRRKGLRSTTTLLGGVAALSDMAATGLLLKKQISLATGKEQIDSVEQMLGNKEMLAFLGLQLVRNGSLALQYYLRKNELNAHQLQ